MDIPVGLRNELALGQRKITNFFGSSAPLTLQVGEIVGAVAGCCRGMYRLRAGWACKFQNMPNGRRAIVDIYVPGDVIGIDALLRNRPLTDVLTLSLATLESIPGRDGLMELMADRSISLYFTWLLSEYQRRAHRLLAAISSLDARGRIAMMVLDFHARLRRRKLITGSTYSLPLTQVQIGDYLGLTMVHVNRVLRSLRDERILSLERHCITILDLDQLRSLAQRELKPSSNTSSVDHTLEEAAD